MYVVKGVRYLSIHIQIPMHTFTGGRGQSGAAVTHSHGNDQDVGSNPAAARNENWTLGTPHRRCPNSPAGSQWKTDDVKGN